MLSPLPSPQFSPFSEIQTTKAKVLMPLNSRHKKTLSSRKKCWGTGLLLCLIILSESAVLFAQAATTYSYVISAGDDRTPYSSTALDGTFSVSVVGGSNNDNYKVREVHRPTISPLLFAY